MIKTDKLKHHCFKQPNDENIKVWRYLDTSKFIDLLIRKSLYFSRLDCFEDKHEGTYPEKNILIRNLQLKECGIKRTYPSHEEFTIENINRTYVNCWYLDNIESEAMWKLYCKNN